MTLNAITQIPELFAIRRYEVSENGVGVSFHASLLKENGDLHDDKVGILKLDDYEAYNSRYTHNPPKVADNLVIVQCGDSSIKLYIIELRQSNGNRPIRRLNPKEIEEKFRAALNDFIESRYPEVFPSTRVKSIMAYLVADPWRMAGKDDSAQLFEKKVKLSALDAYAFRKPLRIFDRFVPINPVMPPNPVITPC